MAEEAGNPSTAALWYRATSASRIATGFPDKARRGAGEVLRTPPPPRPRGIGEIGEPSMQGDRSLLAGGPAPASDEPPAFYSVPKAARQLGMSPATLYC